jgi:hypothetical protein
MGHLPPLKSLTLHAAPVSRPGQPLSRPTPVQRPRASPPARRHRSAKPSNGRARGLGVFAPCLHPAQSRCNHAAWWAPAGLSSGRSERPRRVLIQWPQSMHEPEANLNDPRSIPGTMPLSSDPDRRAAQLANLRPRAAATHEAFSELRLRPLRERHVAELRAVPVRRSGGDRVAGAPPGAAQGARRLAGLAGRDPRPAPRRGVPGGRVARQDRRDVRAAVCAAG